jgi:hypothetical protein
MQAIIDAIQALVSAQDIAGVKAAINQYQQVLLTDEADQVFAQTIENSPPGTPPETANALRNYREIVRLCRQNGIDPTFEELQKPPGRSSESDGDAPPIMQALQAILTAPNIDALQASIQQYAHLLLTDETDTIITQNIDNAPPDAPPGLISALRDRREILRMCRQIGIDETFRRLKEGGGDAGDGDMPPVMQAIQDMLTSRSADEVENTIRRNAHLLLTDEADQIFEQNIQNAPPDTPREFIAGLENARQLLQLCRQHGIDRAFQMMRGGAAPQAGGPSQGYGAPPPGSPAQGYGTPPGGGFSPPSVTGPGYGAPPGGPGHAPIPGDFENRVVTALLGSPREKMELFSYLESLPASVPGMQALIDTAKRAAFGGVANTGGDLSGEYADVWGRIVQRVQSGG